MRIKLTILALLIFTSACSGALTGGTEGNGDTQAEGGSGYADALESTQSGQLIVDLDSDTYDDDQTVVMLYAFNPDRSALGYEVSGVSSESSTASLVKNQESAEQDFNDYQLLMAQSEDMTENFHDFLRTQEEKLATGAQLAISSSQSLRKYATTSSTKTFRVLNSFSSTSSYSTVTATLKLETSRFKFYVDNRNLANVSDIDLENLADSYNAILTEEMDILGSPSDVDGDGKFSVLFTQEVNELGASAGGIVTGFFYAIDLFDRETYDVSNEMEVFYTFVPDADGDYGVPMSASFAFENIYPGVLAHELQHMISFNVHYNENGVSSEQSWLNEGLSHIMEDIYTDFMLPGLENPSRVDNYLESVDTVCFTCGSSLAQRGGSYLFLRFLFDKADAGGFANVSSGKDLVSQLLDGTVHGTDNITNVLYGPTGDENDFLELMGDFGLAIYAAGRGAGDLQYDSDLTSFDLYGDQDDNRGTVLEGPAITQVSTLPYSDAFVASGVTFVSIPKSALESSDELVFEFASAARFGGYLLH